jgi:hypothetical protein
MVGGGDLVIWVALNRVLFLSSSSSLRWKKGRGIYTPSKIVAIAALGAGLFGQKGGKLSSPGLKTLANTSSSYLVDGARGP